MAFDGDRVVWKAGNLTKPPIFRTYDDGNEVVYLSLAIDHQGKPTEFLDVQARGLNKEYIKVQDFDAGDFVIVGGTLATRTKTTGQQVPVLRVSVITKETSFSYKPLDWRCLDKTRQTQPGQDGDAV